MNPSQSAALALGARIRSQRLQLGLTQAGLASQAAIGARTLRRLEESGVISLPGFLRVAAALGLDLNLAAAAISVAPDPRLGRVRRRGLRQPRPVAPPPAVESMPAAEPPSSETPRGRSAASAPTPAPRAQTPQAAAKPTVDPASVAAQAKQNRDAIYQLVGVIVGNRLTNYTAATVVQNVMRARRVPDGDKPAFAAAVESELAGVALENLGRYGLSAASLAAWEKTWDKNHGIDRVLE